MQGKELDWESEGKTYALIGRTTRRGAYIYNDFYSKIKTKKL
jgi:hypothetical protein